MSVEPGVYILWDARRRGWIKVGHEILTGDFRAAERMSHADALLRASNDALRGKPPTFPLLPVHLWDLDNVEAQLTGRCIADPL